MKMIAITGGIGSGKSMVSRLLAVMGYSVYDCDSQALGIVNRNQLLKMQLTHLLGAQAYDEHGEYNRSWVSEQVFSSPGLLRCVNALIHPAVIRDIRRWARELSHSPLAFVETALLRQSGLALQLDGIWRVVAPEPLRIERVQRRSGLSRDDVVRRIEAQRQHESPFSSECVIVNDGCASVIRQVHQALQEYETK